MQIQLFSDQMQLSSFFCTQPMPTAAAMIAREERIIAAQEEVAEEILEKRERIAELRKEIKDDEEALQNAEEDDTELEPDEGEEVIFDAVVPQLQADLNYTRYENELDIRALEEEITELEAKLK